MYSSTQRHELEARKVLLPFRSVTKHYNMERVSSFR